jgi:hypothetical protein
MRMFRGWFSILKMTTLLEVSTTEEFRSVVRFFVGKRTLQRVFIKKWFLFTVEVFVA